MFGANRRIVGEELARRNEEYHNDEEIQKIAKQFETEKVRLKSCSQAPYFSSPNSWNQRAVLYLYQNLPINSKQEFTHKPYLPKEYMAIYM